jgi:DNA-binding NarL/FixJ family response regulator
MQLARAHGYTGPDVHTLLLPIVGARGLLGSIRCGHADLFTEALRRELTVLSGHVAVRLAQLGVTGGTGAADHALARLTARQADVAQRAVRGRTNQEIAAALHVSANTIKKHLKKVYEQLGVASRTELAATLSHAGPVHRYPAGITRLGDVTVTTAG